MKKQLIIAALAATVSAASFADISIKGDAHFQYGNIDIDKDSSLIVPGLAKKAGSTNASQQRVRLHITGKSGDTTVKLGLRNDGGTRVSNGVLSSENAITSGSGAGNGGDKNTAQLNTDYLYLTTKVGALNIKAGDWWDTTGLGVARKGKADADRIEFSTKLNGWKLGFETGADSSSSVFSAIGKVGGFDVKVEHNTGVALKNKAVVNLVNGGIAPTKLQADAYYAAYDALVANTDPAQVLGLIGNVGQTAVAAFGTNAIANISTFSNSAVYPNGFGAFNEGKYTDISVKGKIGNVGVAVEAFLGTNNTLETLRKANLSRVYDDANAYVAHLWTKLNNITWHIAYAKTDAGVAGITGSGNKFSPLGVSILATAPGVNGAGAIGNFGDAEDTVFGIRADMKVAGMGVQVATGKLELAKNLGAFCNFDTGECKVTDFDGTFWDVIVTRPLGKGSNIKFSVGNYEDTTSAAVKIGVKF